MQRFRENGWELPSFFFRRSRLGNSALSPIGWRVHFPYFHDTQPMGTFAQGVSLLFRHFSPAFQFLLRTAQRISNNLWAFSTGAVSSNCPIDFKSISSGYRQNPSNISPFPQSSLVPILKILHQSQSRATAPLKYCTFINPRRWFCSPRPVVNLFIIYSAIFSYIHPLYPYTPLSVV
jgi:hypothetical protein